MQTVTERMELSAGERELSEMVEEFRRQQQGANAAIRAPFIV